MTLDAKTVALVTGASSGIGEATVRALRERGVIVHAAARRLERLKKLQEETGCIPHCLLYTSPSPRDQRGSRMPSSA